MADFNMTDEEILAGLMGEDQAVSDEVLEDSPEEASPEEASPEEKIAELEERLRIMEEERAERERELLCLNLLGEAGLPAELSPAIMAIPDPAAAVGMIRDAVKSAVETEIAKRCRSDAPKAGSRAPLTREELMNLPVAEIQRMRDMGIGVAVQAGR